MSLLLSLLILPTPNQIGITYGQVIPETVMQTAKMTYTTSGRQLATNFTFNATPIFGAKSQNTLQLGKFGVNFSIAGFETWFGSFEREPVRVFFEINEHIKNIFDDEELSPDSVIRNFRITAEDGKIKVIW